LFILRTVGQSYLHRPSTELHLEKFGRKEMADNDLQIVRTAGTTGASALVFSRNVQFVNNYQ
jgi:hypothetical protein